MIDMSRWFEIAMAGFKKNPMEFMVGVFIVSLLSSITLGILYPVMLCGMFTMCLKSLRGQQVDLGDLFSGFQKFGQMAVLIILGVFIVAIGLLPSFSTYLPNSGVGFLIAPSYGIQFFINPILNVLLAFSVYQVADSGLDGVEALSRAWKVFQQNFLMFWVVGFAFAILAVLGIIACCIGILATTAIVHLAYGVAYLDNFTQPISHQQSPPPSP